jgi:hypothetical protein
MTDNGLEINCECHGKGISAVACGHLVKNEGIPIGFIENSNEPSDLQAWCYACEYMYQQESEMTELFKAFNQMVLVCRECYSEIKSHHSVGT